MHHSYCLIKIFIDLPSQVLGLHDIKKYVHYYIHVQCIKVQKYIYSFILQTNVSTCTFPGIIKSLCFMSPAEASFWEALEGLCLSSGFCPYTSAKLMYFSPSESGIAMGAGRKCNSSKCSILTGCT